MITLDKSFIIQILDCLGDIYPRRYLNDSHVFPDQEDRRKIIMHIAYCAGKGLIECDDLWMSNDTLHLNNIRITTGGIDYLLENSK